MNKLRVFVALAALPLLLLLVAGCTGLQGASAGGLLDRSDTTCCSSDGFPAPSKVVAWQSATQVLKEQGYIPDPELTDSNEGYIETRWKLSLQPFAGQGFRERASVKVIPIKGRPNYFRLDTNVMRQMNHNMTQPNSLTAAEWAAGTRNSGMERLINNQVAMMFASGDVSTRYRDMHGLPDTGNVLDPSVKPKKKPTMAETIGGWASGG